MDESTRGRYLVCVVVLAPVDLSPTRQALKKLCKPGQHRIHMSSEGDSRRREILSAIDQLGLQGHVYESDIGSRPQRQARDDCLRAVVPDLVNINVTRLVIESCDQDRQDRLVVQECLAKAEVSDRFTYCHDRPTTEPLLWAPDILAWAYGKGGDWRRRANGTVSSVTRLTS